MTMMSGLSVAWILLLLLLLLLSASSTTIALVGIGSFGEQPTLSFVPSPLTLTLTLTVNGSSIDLL